MNIFQYRRIRKPALLSAAVLLMAYLLVSHAHAGHHLPVDRSQLTGITDAAGRERPYFLSKMTRPSRLTDVILIIAPASPFRRLFSGIIFTRGGSKTSVGYNRLFNKKILVHIPALIQNTFKIEKTMKRIIYI